MDGLLAEVASKRKALESDTQRPKKYMRRGEIERLREEEEQKCKAEKEAQEAAARQEREATSARSTMSPSPVVDSDGGPVAESSFNISNEETIRRLRAKGQPIRLFAESDKDRRLRLRALELIEEKGHDQKAGQNDFKKALEDVENLERELKNKSSKGKKKGDTELVNGGVLDLELVKTDPDKLYPLIYYALKRVLKEWAEAMDERPEHIKHTNQGKLAAATQVQSAEYLKPLFKQLKSRASRFYVLVRIAEIVHYMQKRQYQKANDSYLRLSIGNAPWPIGVTMVGHVPGIPFPCLVVHITFSIHERSAREKISSDQVAHVLNDEVSRKYIQSLKRLLTFSQTKYPPEDVSQLMG
ncbi:Prp18-domain-containing protein [Dendrothele bispora CBS 962.96]|uniref:Pre-mRNA-splicing factor 18 n=1 Tax=Dendrothele bispora (strain CBS 962.96) TaxID=1314807 RepID=A0A4S8MJ65_DENBC|nr:Prp18-domain-containing protein [Dendrothele bispora CBS 962.96]